MYLTYYENFESYRQELKVMWRYLGEEFGRTATLYVNDEQLANSDAPLKLWEKLFYDHLSDHPVPVESKQQALKRFAQALQTFSFSSVSKNTWESLTKSGPTGIVHPPAAQLDADDLNFYVQAKETTKWEIVGHGGEIKFGSDPGLNEIYISPEMYKSEYVLPLNPFQDNLSYTETARELDHLASSLPGMDTVVPYDCNCVGNFSVGLGGVIKATPKDGPLRNVVIHKNDYHGEPLDKIADWLDKLHDDGIIDIEFKAEKLEEPNE